MSIVLWLGWHLGAILSQNSILWERGPGETPCASRCFPYLINSLVRYKNPLLKTSKVAFFLLPLWCLCQKLSYLFTLIKLCYTKTLSGQTWSLVPVKTLPEVTSPASTWLAATNQSIAYFHLDIYRIISPILSPYLFFFLNTLTKSLWLWKIPCSQILGFRVWHLEGSVILANTLGDVFSFWVVLAPG